MQINEDLTMAYVSRKRNCYTSVASNPTSYKVVFLRNMKQLHNLLDLNGILCFPVQKFARAIIPNFKDRCVPSKYLYT